MLTVPVKRLDTGMPIPAYAHVGDAGIDLMATRPVWIKGRGGRSQIPTGIAVAIPKGHAGFIMPRSGLARDHGITCLNTPGLIDSGYRGELTVLLHNTDASDFKVERGMRIAQLVIMAVEQVEWTITTDLGNTPRGAQGFGSTGSH